MIIASDIHVSNKHGISPFTVEIENALRRDHGRTLIMCDDFMCGATKKEYAQVYHWVARFRSQGVNVVLSVDNHDTSRSILITRIPLDKGRRRYGRLGDLIAEQDIVVAKRDEFDFIYAVNRDVFFAPRTTHSRIYNATRVKRDQFEWAMAVLSLEGLTEGNGYRLHLVTHQSLWELPGDKHGHVHKRRRLTAEFLDPLGFSTAINGHNRRFDLGYRPVKEEHVGFLVYHIQAPAASPHKTKGGRFTPGYVEWDPRERGSARFIGLTATSRRAC